MDHREYRDTRRDLAIGVCYVGVDEDMTMPDFKQQVMLDPRILDNPEHVYYTVARLSGLGEDHPLAQENLWHPFHGSANARGVAVFAEGVYRGGQIDPEYLSLAFQGVDDARRTLLAGLNGQKAQREGRMFMMAGGKADADVEGTLQDFLDATGFSDIEFPQNEREQFERDHGKVLSFMKKYSFMGKGIYLPVAPLITDVGESLVRLG